MANNMSAIEGDFDKKIVSRIAERIGHTLSHRKVSKLSKELSEIGLEYFFRLANGPPLKTAGPRKSIGKTKRFAYATSYPNITPFALRNCLEMIEKATNRAYKKSWPSSKQQVGNLLKLLGFHPNGKSFRHIGKENTGHGGSEPNAIWLSLVQSLAVLEKPPLGYRSDPNKRPWKSQRLKDLIGELVEFCNDPDDKQKKEIARLAALRLHNLAKQSVSVASVLVENTNHDRNKGDFAINAIIPDLARVYSRFFGEKQATSRLEDKNEKMGLFIFLIEVLQHLGVPPEKRSLDSLRFRLKMQ
jgi:hypothetical protein